MCFHSRIVYVLLQATSKYFRRQKNESRFALVRTGVAGFEPTHEGVKVPCLTAWLYPNEMVEESGFEPLNPKERIYSPSRLASSLLLQLSRSSLDPTSLSYKKSFLIASGNFNFFTKKVFFLNHVNYVAIKSLQSLKPLTYKNLNLLLLKKLRVPLLLRS